MTHKESDLVLRLLDTCLKINEENSQKPVPDLVKDYMEGYYIGQKGAYELAMNIIKDNCTDKKYTHDTEIL